MSNIRVRIAPSPTGPLHIGTARTALFNYLFSRNKGGAFIIRVEDTDLLRSDVKYERNIFDGLRWLGIDADESPDIGGSHAPYRQTERIETYRRYLEKLFKEEKIFYCFHTEAELEREKESLLEAKRPPIHVCEYRTLDPKEAEMLAETNQNHVIRFKTPFGRTITFNDLIRGELSFVSDVIGDFSIAKRIDVPLYHFAVVVDDETMDITHVIRGEDHIANTPKHILLIEALGFRMPQYAHLPLVLGTDRSKLSKRHGATSIDEYQKLGYLPEALLNFIALLGWNPGDNREILTKEELIQSFSLEHVQKAGAVFDFTKLDWMNGEYIRKKTIAELTDLSLPYLSEMVAQAEIKREYIEKVIALEQPRLKRLSELPEKVEFFFKAPDYDAALLAWKEMSREEIKLSLEKTNQLFEEHKQKNLAEIKSIFLDVGKEMGDRGKLLWPLRIALSGKKSSPDPFEIIDIMGLDETQKRINHALQKVL